jgi:hypothetical protein
MKILIISLKHTHTQKTREQGKTKGENEEIILCVDLAFVCILINQTVGVSFCVCFLAHQLYSSICCSRDASINIFGFVSLILLHDGLGYNI